MPHLQFRGERHGRDYVHQIAPSPNGPRSTDHPPSDKHIIDLSSQNRIRALTAPTNGGAGVKHDGFERQGGGYVLSFTKPGEETRQRNM
ncbi:uncharacterized protein BJX67DRAFT_360270 [Aspergillus lucknowensis]|uniref:Uncharacterized protein n=1 Tax=Aspergillus lucknowensis TaxID=176173 RepID=A0ABR4LJQ1_9EURO